MPELPRTIRRAADPRPKTAARGYGSKWQTYSRSFLAKHPYCVDPLKRHPGRLVVSTVTDHIKPPKMAIALASGDPERIRAASGLFWNKANHQAVCADCNRAKNVESEGGFGNAKRA